MDGDKKAPAPVAQPVAITVGSYGSAFDAPGTKRAYTYKHQPGNLIASRIGASVAQVRPGGDAIDMGLSLLRALEANGFGVFQIGAEGAIPDTVVQPDARFEEWADDQGYPLTPTLQGDGYQDLRTEGAWGAWCAALGAAPAPVAQGDDMQQCRKTLAACLPESPLHALSQKALDELDAPDHEAWHARLWELIDAYRKGHDWPLAMRARIKAHIAKTPAATALVAQGAPAAVKHCEAVREAGRAADASVRYYNEMMGSAPAPVALTTAQIDRIVREVAELPDRGSPEGSPEMMLVTASELRSIIEATGQEGGV